MTRLCRARTALSANREVNEGCARRRDGEAVQQFGAVSRSCHPERERGIWVAGWCAECAETAHDATRRSPRPADVRFVRVLASRRGARGPTPPLLSRIRRSVSVCPAAGEGGSMESFSPLVSRVRDAFTRDDERATHSIQIRCPSPDASSYPFPCSMFIGRDAQQRVRNPGRWKTTCRRAAERPYFESSGIRTQSPSSKNTG